MKTKNLNGYSNIVGSNIRKYRKLKWLSQRQLADQVALLGSLFIMLIFLILKIIIYLFVILNNKQFAKF